MSDLISAFEHLQEERRKRHELTEETPLELCISVRDAGRAFREAGSLDEAVTSLTEDSTISTDEAQERIQQYCILITTNQPVRDWAEFFGSRYFAGHSIDELSSDSRFSRGEIERGIREYFGVHLHEVESSEIDVPDEPPEPERLFDSQRVAVAEVARTVKEVDIASYLDTADEIDSSDFEFKWVDFLVVGVRDELYEIYQEEGEDAVFAALSGMLADEETVDAIFSQLNSRYLREERKELLERSIEAHNRGGYGLAIPAALTQIDGALIEAAIDLGIYEMDDDVTGIHVVSPGEGSPQHIARIREPFREEYPRLMGRGTPRAKILHGIRTDFVNDERLSTKVIWMALKSFSVAEKMFREMHIRDEDILDFLEVSTTKRIDEIAHRFRTNEAHATHRCEQLSEEGFIEETSDGLFTVTDDGNDRLSELRGF